MNALRIIRERHNRHIQHEQTADRVRSLISAIAFLVSLSRQPVTYIR